MELNWTRPSLHCSFSRRRFTPSRRTPLLAAPRRVAWGEGLEALPQRGQGEVEHTEKAAWGRGAWRSGVGAEKEEEEAGGRGSKGVVGAEKDEEEAGGRGSEGAVGAEEEEEGAGGEEEE